MKTMDARIALFTLMALFLGAGPAAAIDMTGTWTFTKVTCKGVDQAGTKLKLPSLTPAILGVLEVGKPDLESDVLPAVALGAEAASGYAFGNGTKGTALFRTCAYPLNIYLKKVKTHTENKKGFTGTATGDARFLFEGNAVVCAVKLGRTSAADPGLPAETCDLDPPILE